jgi:hypothetical protein
MTLKAAFPDNLAWNRTGRGRPSACKAVSGRNILILAVHASFLRPFGTAG